jgi:hypothetical protein
MLVSDLMAAVRDVLQDDDADRYSDARLLRGLNLGILDLRRVRPDHFIGRYSEPTWQASALTDVFPLPEVVVPSLVKYVSGWVELADDEYTQDGRAAGLLSAFRTDLGLG